MPIQPGIFNTPTDGGYLENGRGPRQRGCSRVENVGGLVTQSTLVDVEGPVVTTSQRQRRQRRATAARHVPRRRSTSFQTQVAVARQLDAGGLDEAAGPTVETVEQSGGALNRPRVVAGTDRHDAAAGRRQPPVAATTKDEAEPQHLERAGGGQLGAGAGRRRRVEPVPSPRRVRRRGSRVHGGGEAGGLGTVDGRGPDVT